MNKLHDFLDEQEQVANEGFKVDDDQKANWALRKIKQMQEQIKENNDLADAEIDKIEFWRKTENEKAEADIEYFQSLLAEYAMHKREKDPKFKSLKLPNGRFGFRKRPAKWEYDEEKVLEHLKESELTDFVRVKEEINKRDLRQFVEVAGDKVINPETGEIIEGIEIVEQGENFNVKVVD